MDEIVVNAIEVDDPLEAVQNRIAADSIVDGLKSFGFELFEHSLLVVTVKGVDDLIGEAHKTIDSIDRIPVLLSEYPDAKRERSTVVLRRLLTDINGITRV